jgi:hypothetical protein
VHNVDPFESGLASINRQRDSISLQISTPHRRVFFLLSLAPKRLLDANNALHPFTTPTILDDVSLVTYDGAGHFARTDFGNVNGVPKGGQTAFNPNQSGTYTVNQDCTGTMQNVYSSCVVLGLEMVIADDGSAVKAIIGTETVPSRGPTADGTTCPPSCGERVQVSLDGKKVVVYGFR